jgi:hypothetical protein
VDEALGVPLPQPAADPVYPGRPALARGGSHSVEERADDAVLVHAQRFSKKWTRIRSAWPASPGTSCVGSRGRLGGAAEFARQDRGRAGTRPETIGTCQTA